MLYFISQRLFCNCYFVFLILSNFFTQPSNPPPISQLLVCSLCLLVFLIYFLFLDSTYKWNHMILVFLWLIVLNISSRSIHVVRNSKISFFLWQGNIQFYLCTASLSTCLFLYFYFLLNHFYCYSTTVVPIFPTLSSYAHPPPTPTVSSHTVVHVCGSFIHDLCLVPSSSFHHYSSTLSLLVSFSLFHVSMPLVLFCLIVYFVHWIPLIGDIIWHLSFTNWLISLSILFSRSIFVMAKGRSSFLLSAT